jgi:hypothetical protein
MSYLNSRNIDSKLYQIPEKLSENRLTLGS